MIYITFNCDQILFVIIVLEESISQIVSIILRMRFYLKIQYNHLKFLKFDIFWMKYNLKDCIIHMSIFLTILLLQAAKLYLCPNLDSNILIGLQWKIIEMIFMRQFYDNRTKIFGSWYHLLFDIRIFSWSFSLKKLWINNDDIINNKIFSTTIYQDFPKCIEMNHHYFSVEWFT